jgi:hypothetical protein
VLVGYAAAKRYLDCYLKDIGRVVEVKPSGSMRIVSQVLPHNYTSSGVIGLRQISGTPLKVVVQAADDDWSIRNLSPTLSLSKSIFPNPSKEVDASYSVGGPWAFIRIGKHPITNGTEENLRLDGNYGVIYNLNINVNNPTQTRRKIEVLFEATAGPSRAIFIDNMELICIKHTAAPAEEKVMSFSLAPGESRTLHLKTMPLAGSAYPATVIVKS